FAPTKCRSAARVFGPTIGQRHRASKMRSTPMASMTATPAHEPAKREFNPLTIRGVDHIEFFVDSAEDWAKYHETRLGMWRRAHGDASTGLRGRKSIVVGQGRINFLFAEPQGDGPEADAIRQHLARHGN